METPSRHRLGRSDDGPAEDRTTGETAVAAVDLSRLSLLSPAQLDELLAEDARYWLEALEGDLSPSGIPLDFERPQGWSEQREKLSFALEPESVAALLKMCNRQPALVLVALVTALKICLKRYNDSEEVLIGTGIHKRHRDVTPLNRVVVLRDQLREDMTARQLLVGVKKTLSEAFSHQKYPFDRIVERLGLAFPENRNPLFAVLVRLDGIHQLEELGALRHDVGLDLELSNGDLGGELTYRPELHRRETLKLFLHHFRLSVASVVRDPSSRLADLDLLREDRRRQLVLGYNRAALQADAAPSADGRTVLSLFAEQVAGAPGAIALEFAGDTWTYRRLDAESHRLACFLRRHGAAGGTKIGICLEHSPRLVVAILAVVMAGGVAVPLDPEYPAARKRFIVRDSAMAILVTTRGLAEDSAEESVKTLCLDEDAAAIAEQPPEALEQPISSRHPAYVLYTSGSTGEPKGVEVSHGSLASYVKWAAETYSPGERLSCGLYTSIAFDLTLTSLFLPLIHGGRLIIYGEDTRSFAEILDDGRVELLKMTPSHLSLFQDRDLAGSRLRCLVVGGEAFHTALAAKLQRALGPEVKIYNEYGPTEATVGCMIHRFDPARDRRMAVPIGVPAAGARIYVLDGRLRPTAENVPGELYIGGAGLAMGYFCRPDLTADRFVPDPFVADSRLYRTGDLARHLPGGGLEYLGRNDEQVKYHGYRIELNEIRLALNRHRKIRNSTVMLVREDHGDDVLVAYYAARDEQDPEDLRRFLARRLIEATVPSLFIHLKKLPLSLAGKVDVRVLPKLEEVRSRLRRAYAAPRTATEEAVCAIWQAMLGSGPASAGGPDPGAESSRRARRIGIHDNFFTLGGHSLVATRIISRIRQALGVELPLRRLFDAPSVARLSELIDELADSSATATAPPLTRVPRDGTLPLSFAQQRLWFIDQLQPGSASYNIPAIVRLKGELDLAAMARTLQEISRRHEVLRTTFTEVDGRPTAQVIHPQRSLALPLVDLSGLAAEARQAEAQRLAEIDARQPFDLTRGPLLRVTLVRLAVREHHVVATQHHIVSDAWSLEILRRELAMIYEHSRQAGRSPTARTALPELPIQYVDFADWQRRWLSGEVLEEQLEYWRRQLSGAPPVLELPLDRPRPVAHRFRGARVPFEIPEAAAASLKRLGTEHQATLFITLLAVFQQLLSRYADSGDVCVGSPVAGRHRVELEGLIGFFVNTLVLRSRISQEWRFQEFLEQVRETVLDALGHQDLPFEKLVEELEPERSLSHSPLFQVVFYLGSQDLELFELEDLEVEPFEVELGTSKFDLMLVAMDSGERISGTLEYNSDLFEETTVRRLLMHWRSLLSAVARRPRARLEELPLLASPERHQLLVEWNARRPAGAARTVLERFEFQVERSPAAVAVSVAGQPEQALDYRQLQERVDLLAWHLRRRGVGSGVKVGVCLPRSPELVVALLAIMKAGGAFVPLDPEHPAARRRFVMRDSEMSFLVTSRRLGDDLAADGVEQIHPDGARESAAPESLPGGAGPSDVAYVLYTSGTTGVPKGVEIRHGSLANYLDWAGDAYLREQTFSCGLFTSVAFDLTITSIFLPLITGSRLYVYQEDLSGNPAKILLDGIEMLKMTPSHLSLIGDDDLRNSRARRLVVGGEAFTSALAARLERAAGPELEIFNEYGPTEATVACMIHRYRPANDGRETVPIGVPAGGARTYLLDRRLRPVPENVLGELFIAGDGLAMGYLRRPSLTAERFLPDPFEPDSRLYRTGDVARRRHGLLEYVGRNDHQIQYHGHRIELGEIRALLNRHRKVRDSICRVVHDEASGAGVLVAYYASREEQPADELRQHLGRHLIPATIPSFFVHLKRLPLSLSGKVDVGALPTLEQIRGKLGQAYAAPGTPTEELVAEIWRQVLGVERISARANFFDVGGHSLLATQVLSRLRSLFGVDLPLRRLFEQPTVARLAKCIETAKRTEDRRRAPPLVPRPEQANVELSFAQRRLWFLDQLEPGSTAYSMPFAFALAGPLDVAALARSFDQIVRRHEILRTTFAAVNGDPVQVIHPPRPRDTLVVDLQSLTEPARGAEVQRLGRADTARPFDLARGPLLRLAVLRLAPLEHVVLLNMHHIASDGWSITVLLEELQALYQAFLNDRRSPLPELPVQYADFAVWQRGWLRDEVLADELEYWQRQLAGLPPILELPTDRLRPEVQSHRGGHRSFQLSPWMSTALRALARECQATLFMNLLAGFQTLLWHTAGQRDFAVGSAVSGRHHVDVERLIGFFVNTLVLRADLGRDAAGREPSFQDLLARTRETVLDAHAHQDIPFEKLVEELQPERSLDRSPLLQVLFIYGYLPRGEMAVGDLVLRPVEIEGGIAKFDLSLGVSEAEHGIQGTIAFNSELFDGTTIARMTGHFRTLLGWVVAHPERPLSQVPMLSKAEQHQLLVELNENRSAAARSRWPAAKGTCAHQLFEAQAKRHGDAAAIVVGQQVLSYRQLNERADRLALSMCRQGVTAGTRVGMCLERSPELLVALLAVLKAGGGFVPLDPEHPSERQRFVIRDSGATFLLTTPALGKDLATEGVRQVHPDAGDEDDGEPRIRASFEDRVGASDLAYVLYTSGSTGRPKGVAIRHGSLSNYLSWAREVYLRDEPLSCGLYTSVAFDLTLTSIFLPLISGGRLIVYDRQTATDPAKILEGGVDVLKMTPSHLSLLGDRDLRSSRVRRLVVGGEAFSSALAARLQRAFGADVEIYNEYGPTEATVACMIHRYDPACDAQAAVPIGRPAGGARIYLLDPWLRPVAENVHGEIYIGGDGLAMGYAGRPGQTAERFVPDPFAPDSRLYRTGDIACYRRGALHYLGRNDDQVKYHGHRIELDEIRAVLNRHRRVRDSVCVLRREATLGGDVLVAYYASREKQSADELRQFLARYLIEATIPSLFVHLKKLPISLSGKVDVRALPQLAQIRGEVQQAYLAPRTPTEELLAAIWVEALGLDRVSVQDNFFHLGGHSLLATRVLSRLRSVFGVELQLRRLFEAPILARLAVLVDAERRDSSGQVTAPRPRPRSGEPVPLSFAQQRLWFLDQLEPGSTAYNMPFAFELVGPLDLTAFARSFDEVVRRHHTLRTTFPAVDGQPRQLIAPHAPQRAPRIDLEALAEPDRQTEVRRFAHVDAGRPFDLVRGPLLRFSLLRFTARHHIVLLNMHHIVSDGWSMEVLAAELTSLYPALLAGDPSPLPELPIQYADFAVWQRGWLEGQVLEAQRSYWREQLAGLPPVLELPTDRPRPMMQTHRGDLCLLKLSPRLSRALRELAQRQQATLFMTVLAGFQVWLARITGQADFAVGAPVAGRTHVETDGLIGFFVNTLVLRADLPRDVPEERFSFEDLLPRVRETVLDALSHQDIPFEKLVEEMQSERSLDRSPLFQVTFSLGEQAPAEVDVADLELRPLALVRGIAKFDLSLGLSEGDQGIEGAMSFNADLFDGSTIARFGRYFQRLLAEVTDAPRKPLSELALLTRPEQQQLLVEWNATGTEYPRELCVHQLFEAQVDRRPDAVALVFGEQSLTYRGLDVRANRVSHRLRRLGVGSGTPVAICMERGVGMVVGTLAILKAGGAYVPLDPSYPAERLDFMLDDTGAPVLLIERQAATPAPSRSVATLSLDDQAAEIAEESGGAPRCRTRASQPLYVIYTSGSTGRPKGVVVPHRAVNRLVVNTDYIELSARDRIAQISNASFDAIAFELWGALLHGACLFGIPTEVALAPAEFARELRRGQVNVMFVTTALFNQLVAEVPDIFAGLRQLHFGGEAVDPRWVAEALRQGPPERLVHVYGPTESTTFASWQVVAEVPDDARTLPIGRPLANTELYVLGRELRPMPIGAAGELYLGGDGLAHGYLNRPALSAERFLPHGSAAEPGARLYRTGDLVRSLTTGSIEFLGRVDHQVKLRGFRIELGEIEAVLGQHASVEQTAVVLRDDDPRLIAYVVLTADDRTAEGEVAEGAASTLGSLRQSLARLLPEYMLPQALVPLGALPLTANGKVDRKALAGRSLSLPESLRQGQEYPFVAPRTATEGMLAVIWAEVLGYETGGDHRIGVLDDFFELGGHSLLATRIVSRIRATLAVELPLRHLFETQTIAQLAERIDRTSRAAAGAPRAPALPRPDEAPPLSFAQERLWFLDQLEPGSTAYSMPFAFELTGPLDLAAFEHSFGVVVRRHETLRTTIDATGGRPVQIIAPPGPLAVPRVDLDGLAELDRRAEARRLARADAARAFDLARGPLVRLSVVRLADRRHAVLLNMHHVISDGWSMHLLIEELSTLYAAALEQTDTRTALPDLPIQYADFAAWQRDWLHGEVLEKQMGYWRRQLTGMPATLRLPTDRPRSAGRSPQGAVHRFRLTLRLSARLRAFARERQSTQFMAFLAAFQSLLARTADQYDFAIGTPIAGRDRLEIERLIGFFINTLVLRSNLAWDSAEHSRADRDPSFSDLLTRVRDTVLEAYAYQDLPFEKLVEELRPERSLDRSPLFQVMFSYEKLAKPRTKVADLTLRGLEVTDATCKFDLIVTLTEGDERLAGAVEYNRDLFDATTIARMAGHFQGLLEWAVAHPKRRLSQVPMLRQVELHQLLVELNEDRSTADGRSRLPASGGTCAHQLFEAQARRQGDAVAIVLGQQCLSYRQLNERAGRLALALRRQGVAAGTRVGICLERSPELLVALLAVLKAGGGFVPLDPEHPTQRQRFVTRDSGATLLLTTPALGKDLATPGVRQIQPEVGDEAGETEIPAGFENRVATHDLAYVLYTSGSTGRPKGVEIRHGSLSNYLCWARGVYLRDEALSCGLYTSVAFDLTLTSIFLPLISGGRLILFDPATETDPEKILEGGVEVVKMTPSHLSLLADRELLSSRVRRLVVGGEAFSSKLAAQLGRTLGPDVQIYNEYGPTEATVACMIHRYHPARDTRAAVAIGRPAGGARIYLLDPWLRPVAENVSGEIYIAGDGLAMGYAGRPGQTAERFLPDPFAPDSRLYRTGDIACTRHGVLHYLGRNDDQVKYHGHRIEQGEIRAALNRHRKIRDSVCVLRRKAALGGDVLVAYYASRVELPADELRQFLVRYLIEATIPSFFVHLKKLPLSLSGKVDVRGLPPLARTRGQVQDVYLAPSTPTEELLAAIWGEVLSFDRISARDNFFHLGGHSLLATQVLSRLRSVFGVELPLRRLFEAPILAQLAARVDAARRASGSEATAPRRRPRHDQAPPLSFAQERMWFLDQLAPGSTAYSMPFAFELTGPLDFAAFARSFDEVTRRHETLRTTFTAAGGKPVQIIAPAAPRDLPRVDLGTLQEPDRRAEVRRLARAAAARAFDLARGPLVRLVLLRLEVEQHVVLLNMHHIITDGWSMEVLVRELRVLYPAFLDGVGTRPLPELEVQYADFAVWQRGWLRDRVLEEQFAYWREQLAGLPPALELPTDRPRPAVMSYRGGARSLSLSPRLSTALHGIARRQQATLFMTLLAGFQAVLWRTTGQRDFAVGTPVAGRNRLEIEGLIGFFVNTLVLRSGLAPVQGDSAGCEPNFLQLLSRVREAVLDAHTHQDVPFEKLVEKLRPERHLDRSPLFQVTLTFGNLSQGATEVAGLELRTLELGEVLAKFDLNLGLSEGDHGLVGSLVYNTDLFDTTTIVRLADHFKRLLEAATAEPEEQLSELSLLAEAERHQLLAEWNDNRIDAPFELPIQRLFEDQAARRPGAVAVVFGDEMLSYLELDGRANQLAHRLRRLGIGPEIVVGLCLERGMDLLVGMLGVLKAGGAFLPLDPSYPADRLRFMVEDTRAPVLLTAGTAARSLSWPTARVLDLGKASHDLNGEPETPPACPALASHPAYVIYTSGSTGTPKGVVVSHRNLQPLLLWFRSYFPLDSETRVLQTLSPAFDFGAFELLTTLFCGGRLVFTEPEIWGDPLLYARAAEAHAVNTIHSTPSFFREAVAAGARFDGLEILHLGGEALNREHIDRLFSAVGPRCRIYNGYGPTETTVNSNIFALGRAARRRDAGRLAIPIGRASANNRTYVLDRWGRPAAAGVPGELYIGGDGGARGYLRRPRQTAERFLPDAIGGGPGGRLYRTGDLTRWLADGNPEFLGRIDQQVKLRGFRIELGEIESVLGRHPAVGEAVAVVRQNRLVAFLVAAGEPIAGAELRQWLKSRLPGPMVPSALVSLESLPLTPNGKVDRATLERRPLPAAEVSRARVAPRTPTEELVAAIWSEVLGDDAGRIGVLDDFFELGGHSLLATQVIARVRSTFAVELPLRRLFEGPTLARLAAGIDRARRSADRAVKTLSRRPPSDQPAPLSFAQERLWFLDQLEPGSTVYSMPFAFELSGPLDLPALAHSFDAVVRRHEALRTTFTAADGRPVQVIAPPARLAVPWVDLQALAAADHRTEAQRLARADAERPFELARGPLVRLSIVRLAERQHVVLLNLHHIVSDGWSMSILVEEISTLYRAALDGARTEFAPLPELPVQYADYAVWQREWLRGEVLEEQMDYWRRQLAGLPPTMRLPTDRPRPAVQSHRGAVHRFHLSPRLSSRLRAFARGHQSTLFMTFLAGFQSLLARTTGQYDFAVGTPTAGRDLLEIERLIGFFVNTLALRSSLGWDGAEQRASDRDPSFSDLLAWVRDTVLDAYAHQDIPFEKMVEELRPERSLEHSPLFQVMLSFEQLPGRGVGVAELTMRGLETTAATAKFDLTVTLTDGRQQMAGAVEYNRDLFDATTVERLGVHLERLLDDAVASPDRRVLELSLITPPERHQLITEWQRGGETTGEQPPLPVHRQFEARAERTPEGVALAFDRGLLSYRQLNAHANRLAHRLRRRGVGPETRVGLYVERSPEMIVAVLGVLKAGGAYVPLDPAYPVDRLRYMLEDAGIRLVLARRRAPMADVGFPGETLWLDIGRDAPAAGDARPPEPLALPDHPAYVIYTSGSTGRPKGVVITHRSLASYVRQATEKYAVASADRMLQFNSLSFDASVEEIYPTLLEGATLVIPGLADVTTRGFLAKCELWDVTVLTLPTAYWHTLMVDLAEASESWPASVRLTILGGEEARVEALLVWRRRVASPLLNTYGPTEATVAATAWQAAAGWAPASRHGLPIGRPMTRARTGLFGDSLRAAPIGVAGELCLGGDVLARGYLERPALTAEKFVPDPLGKAGARLYRTGDLTRFAADGNLEFRGRIDHQVKLRGFRVELEEIEAALAVLPAVREAAVTVGRSASGDQRLAAFLVPRAASTAGDGQIDESELPTALKQTLPDFMIPALFVPLEALPHLPSGKVDRKALDRLLAAKAPSAKDAATFAPPRDALELRLARIMEEVLDRRPVGRRDDFFALGGHSLMAVRLVALIERALGQPLPLSALFQSPTVASLAGALHGETAPLAESPLVAIQSAGSRRPLFLVHGVGGNAFSFVPLSYALDAEQPVYAFQSAGLIDGLEMDLTVEAMVDRYLELLLSMQPAGPYQLGGWSMGGLVAFEMARQLTARGEKVALLALLDSFPRGHRDERQAEDPVRLIAAFARYAGLEDLEQVSRAVAPAELGSLSKEEILARLVERARQAGTWAPELESTRLEHLLAVFKANLLALARYRGTRRRLRRYPGRTLLLHAAEGAAGKVPLERQWGRLISRLESRQVPGDHHTMMLAPHAAVLAEQLAAELNDDPEGTEADGRHRSDDTQGAR